VCVRAIECKSERERESPKERVRESQRERERVYVCERECKYSMDDFYREKARKRERTRECV